MRKDVAKKWIKALRSGRYLQGSSRLCKTFQDGDRFCCLGVLTELYIQEKNRTYKRKHIGWEPLDDALSFEGETHLLPDEVLTWADMRSVEGRYKGAASLINDNDRGKTFEEVADIIEQMQEEL